MKKIFILLSICLGSLSVSAQKINEKYQYHIKRATSSIRVDGKLDDAEWQRCETTQDFWMMTPADTSKANCRTEAKFTYDDNFLYFSAINYQAKEGPYTVESLKRDFNFGLNDNLWLILEPFNDLTNGWVFGTNAAGAQFDGQIGDGTNLNANWDNRWSSQTSFDGKKWILEMAIPFSSLRYKAGETNWGMNLSRLDLGSNEKSTWAPIPRQFFSITLAYTGTLVWDNPPPTPKTNISIIPYLLTGVNKSFEKNEDAVIRKDIGGDAKIAITPSLNLDLTVNPDFSQVDVDQQVTNLNRFELFFPERRQFFLENSDIFNSFGSEETRPFFSRRIGLGTPIQYGARLSGKLDNNWRVGLLNIQTSANKDTSVGLPTYNYSVLALQRKVFSRSNISMMIVNKESVGFGVDNARKGFTQYSRNAVIQYNLASKSNKWSGKIALMKSFAPDQNTDDFTQHLNLSYTTREWTISSVFTRVGENYRAEVGFVPRRGYHYFSPSISYTFYPKKTDSKIVSHGPKLMAFMYKNNRENVPLNETLSSDNANTEAVIYNFTFRSRALFEIWGGNDNTILFSQFNPINPYKNEYYVKNRSEHSWTSWGTSFTSTPRSLLTYGFNTRYGAYYGNGTRLRLNAQLGYRFQPFVSISLSGEYNKIKDVNLFDKQTDKPVVAGTDFWLIQSKFDITFTNKLFWTTYFQYNEQVSNVNLNSRIQWRYKPASDIFLVYSDNYLPQNLGIKNRSIVVKWNYWWNI
ncbi:DUF5916 domain-containing protein [Arcicella sp. LKC2W]|uniref:DUF5916 domain-containing protein n=1 Tax=Arcicella sp. LKC2W TaxID=2984198 RepID=UPI002B210688|nr:DUF5916 domain-containing protein [Arcicella sp. LKC2W]MEA5458194.1 DUF5916 domain-containing protein [Arcicella sp. LKC2W]